MNIMIYINKDVEPIFVGEDNKSGLVNELLRAHYENIKPTVEMTEADYRKANETSDEWNEVSPRKEVAFDILKQGKGGRYNGDTPIVDASLGLACCKKTTPCKHWLWNGADSQYVNSLTGEIREVL